MKNPVFEKAFQVFLKLPDGSEHEIPGIIAVARSHDLPRGSLDMSVIKISVSDEAVRFE